MRWMTERKWKKRGLLAFFLSGALWAALLLMPQAAALEAKTLIPVGQTVGIKLFSEGVVVIGLAEVETADGARSPGQACGLRVGDVIAGANGTEVSSSEQFADLIQCGGTVELSVSRDGQALTLAAQPVLGEDGTYRLGAWIRDSMAGIGTMTFYDPTTGVFGALGHGVTDCDTGLLMPLGDGSVMASTVKAVRRGIAGEPGELKGSFDLTRDTGTLYRNTEQGLFGVLDADCIPTGEALPVAAADEIKTGPAVIRANVTGDSVEEYTVEILRVMGSSATQNLLLHVTDERLIAQTGGIVQGMSGSPILQNGKLIGAVTHVLVNDPTKGYGIFIENMLDAAG